MLIQIQHLALAATAMLSLASACLAGALGNIAPLPRPTLGIRGLKRGAALRDYPAFAAIEPLMRWLAALIARAPLTGARTRIAQRVAEAGDALGLDADECLALACLSGATFAVAGGLIASALDIAPGWALLFAAFGVAMPLERVRSLGTKRKRRLARELPAAIDLIALCMGAGLDFANALGLLVTRPSTADSPLAAEFGRVLSEIALGRTRGEALSALALRAPIDAVRDFTAAVIQAELKGNPLREAIAIQARVLRMRRSVRAEEAAARASVLLAFPLLLLLASLLLLMLGPFFVNGVEL
jgi:tight adherence protein C